MERCRGWGSVKRVQRVGKCGEGVEGGEVWRGVEGVEDGEVWRGCREGGEA